MSTKEIIIVVAIYFITFATNLWAIKENKNGRN